MILAAGRGERMRSLTDHCPKPLLKISGKPLIEYHLESLKCAGIEEIIINHAYLGEKIENALGKGHQFGVNISYSAEGDNGLETGGGITKALPLLGESPFIVINADIWTNYDFNQLTSISSLAHLVLVENPAHHPQGDFGLTNKLVTNQAAEQFTFSGIGVYHPELFKNCQPVKFKLAPLLRKTIEQQKVTGELFQGDWSDIGTPERLLDIEQQLEKENK
mgnify:CR=1 FL=1